MSKRILLGVDTTLSPVTQQAMQVTCELIASSSSPCSLVLLTVIPLRQIVTMQPGLVIGHVETLLPSPLQKQQAEETQRKARLFLHRQGCIPDSIEGQVRIGAPAEEIVRIAREKYVDLVVLGSHGDSLLQRLRRLWGSCISQHVQRYAPCPVVVVVPARTPHIPNPDDLVTWYREALQRYLDDHEQLSVFTAEQVAQRFTPPGKTASSTERELKAATHALEQLAAHGKLCRHECKGEIRYTND